jgi:Transglycosylase-like domain
MSATSEVSVRVALLTLVSFVLSLPQAAPVQAQDETPIELKTGKGKKAPGCRPARRGLVFYRLRHSSWSQMRGISARADLSIPRSCARTRRLAEIWRWQAWIARYRYQRWQEGRLQRERRALYEKWRCIHEHEGAWDANTGNGYYGGLQMDVTFQRSHGLRFYERWGTADQWPVWAQLEAAEDAYRTRGFTPWPNTARMCGVL